MSVPYLDFGLPLAVYFSADFVDDSFDYEGYLLFVATLPILFFLVFLTKLLTSFFHSSIFCFAYLVISSMLAEVWFYVGVAKGEADFDDDALGAVVEEDEGFDGFEVVL